MLKETGLVPFFALFLLSLTASGPATAQTGGPAARGSYWFWLEDDVTRYVELDARSDEKGNTTGSMTLLDQSRIPFVDDPEDPRAGDAPPEFYVKADLDGLTIEKNRAVLSGTVLDSSHPSYIGRWVQLVVEDNGADQRVPDRLTWAICRPQERGWIPSDAELPYDDGAFLRWWATDAERDDDVGVPSPNLLGNEERSCQLYPLSVYSFVAPRKWEGDLVVLP